MHPQLDHHQSLSKTKILLMSRPDTVFFTSVCFSLKHIWDDSIPTACTDGQVIMINTKFFMGLSVDERMFLLLHETMHVAYMHIARAENYPNKAKANSAMDYVINLMLVDRGFIMPKCGLLDAAFRGMSWEEVYKLLPDNQPPPELGMDVLPSPLNGDELTQAVQDILVRAAIQSKMSGDSPGTIPGDIQIYLDNLLNPKLPWHHILRKYLQSFAKNDYSFRKPNRRYFPKYHLPSLYGENLVDLAVAVDTSGSVTDADFKVFITEVHSILRMMKPEKITLVQFDTEIKSVDPVRNVQELMNIKFSGRGGTHITPVIQWANKNKPQLLVVFSDGEFKFYDTSTKAQTLWVVHNNHKFTAPFGKVIHYAI